jgi:hypothetical protein
MSTTYRAVQVSRPGRLEMAERELRLARGARPVPVDRAIGRVPACPSRRRPGSTRPCPYFLRQATGQARGHGGEQLADTQQRSGSGLTETRIVFAHSSARGYHSGGSLVFSERSGFPDNSPVFRRTKPVNSARSSWAQHMHHMAVCYTNRQRAETILAGGRAYLKRLAARATDGDRPVSSRTVEAQLRAIWEWGSAVE